MANIYLAGDPHGSFTHIIEAVERGRPDVVIILGDLLAPRPLHLELAPILDRTIIRFIPGNHDSETLAHYQNVFDSHIASHNLHGRVEAIAGVRVAGLGGVFRGKVWMPPEQPIFPSYESYCEALRSSRPLRERGIDQIGLGTRERRHKSTIFYDVYRCLMSQRADVLVAHEAPSCHPHGFTPIDELARSMGVHAAFHGHHHDSRDYSTQWQELGFKAYGVGFRGITSLSGEVIDPGISSIAT